MMKLDLQYTGQEQALDSLREETLKAFDVLQNKSGKGNDFLGWIDLPVNYDREEFQRILEAAKRIREDSEALVVIGIGGSYLGARAVVDALTPAYGTKKPEILFAGNQISGQETAELLEYLENKKFSINVISKSGTTTEPAIAFRLFRDLLVKQIGEAEAVHRIYVTTDRARGALKTLADEIGYEKFVVPDDVGGRFTVLTAVGLLPIAAAGIDIQALMEGAQAMREVVCRRDFESNPAMRYAAMREIMYRSGKAIEIMVAYEPRLRFFEEWWKQLDGESLGKEGKSLFPASVLNTTDLHSMGQWIQEGVRNIFETVLWVESMDKDVKIPADAGNQDGLNYLAGKSMHYVNEQAMRGTRKAHIDGNVPNVFLSMEKLDAFHLGEMIYFFETVTGICGYMLGVNPFNQPGVEMYKTNMFELLGKPGYERN